MRPYTIITAFSLVATVSAAAILSDRGSAINVGGQELDTRGDHALAPDQLETRDLAPRWGGTYEWPETSYAGGTISYQFQVVNLGSDRFRFQFFHSGPLNGPSFKYTFTAPGQTVTKTLTPTDRSVSFEVTKSGTSFQIDINQI